MAIKIIVSYDGTENDTDGLALGRLLAQSGGSLAPPKDCATSPSASAPT